MSPALALLILAAPQGSLDVSGWKDPGPYKVAHAPTNHFNMRPEGTVVDTIVLHHTAGSTLTGVVKWFAMEESRVSAHFTVGKDGSIAYHVNPFYRAWHAGASRDPQGRDNVNNFSVGIEIVNVGDGKDPYPPVQVRTVALLCAYLVRHRHEGQIKQIISHEWIAVPTGRKNDPINYPWDSLDELAKSENLKLIFGTPNPRHEARS